MTADPQRSRQLAEALLYDGRHTHKEKQQAEEIIALAAQLEAAERDNERLRRERREAVGLALWVAAIESQPVESRVAWVEEMVERYFVVRVQRRDALAVAQQPHAGRPPGRVT